MFSNHTTPQDNTDRFVLYAHTCFILFGWALSLLSDLTVSDYLTPLLLSLSDKLPHKNCIPKSFLIRNVCLCYAVKVFFYYGNPFHYLRFGLSTIFVKPKDFFS